jgi:hypothetical protein
MTEATTNLLEHFQHEFFSEIQWKLEVNMILYRSTMDKKEDKPNDSTELDKKEDKPNDSSELDKGREKITQDELQAIEREKVLYYHLVYLPFLLSVGQHCFPFLVVL